MRDWHARSPSRNFSDVPGDIGSARLGSASLSGVGQEQVGECRVEHSLRAADRARPSTHRLICSLGAQRQMDGQSKCAARLPDRMSLDDDAPASDS